MKSQDRLLPQWLPERRPTTTFRMWYADGGEVESTSTRGLQELWRCWEALSLLLHRSQKLSLCHPRRDGHGEEVELCIELAKKNTSYRLSLQSLGSKVKRRSIIDLFTAPIRSNLQIAY